MRKRKSKKDDNTPIYVALGAAALFLFSRSSSASGAASGSAADGSGTFKVTNASGQPVGTYTTLSAAQAAAKTAGDATSSARVYDLNGTLLYTYINPAYAAGMSVVSAASGMDWNPQDSPYYQDVISAFGG